MIINILTEGFRSTNGIGFLYPILFNKKRLKENFNMEVNIYTKRSKKLFECNVLICDSKFYKSYWKDQKQKIFQDFIEYKKNIDKVYFYDSGDSSGFLLAEILPYVDKYIKSFVYKDKTLYMKDFYGGRIWTDFYHKKFNIKDETELKNQIVKDKTLLNKIEVGYNQSLVNYSINGRFIFGNWKNEFFRKILKLKYTDENDFIKPSLKRKIDVSCRMGVHYNRKSVSFQRIKMKELLKKYLQTNKLNRKSYFEEISNSKAVISPFGWGELNSPRDYEVALNGALLIKPEISHLDTWPNYFTKENIVTFKWDFSDLYDVIENVINNYDKYLQKAINYQNMYKYYITTENGYNNFCKYFNGLIK